MKAVTVSWPVVTVVSDILVTRHGACHQRLWLCFIVCYHESWQNDTCCFRAV